MFRFFPVCNFYYDILLIRLFGMGGSRAVDGGDFYCIEMVPEDLSGGFSRSIFEVNPVVGGPCTGFIPIPFIYSAYDQTGGFGNDICFCFGFGQIDRS
ncbi:MAG: hypothetical protein LUG51_10620 [Tannerellaceae bacterium]|nr:hypothetical protein [Tannerellaceae bacterium]